MSGTLRNQIFSFIRQGYGIIDLINFLFTCDYNRKEIKEILSEFGFSNKAITETLKANF